jgi:hypothetical protein
MEGVFTLDRRKFSVRASSMALVASSAVATSMIRLAALSPDRGELRASRPLLVDLSSQHNALPTHTNLLQALDFRLANVLSAVVSMVAGVILAFFFGWKMALLVLAIFPLVGFGGYIRMRLREGGAKNDSQLLEEAGKVQSRGGQLRGGTGGTGGTECTSQCVGKNRHCQRVCLNRRSVCHFAGSVDTHAGSVGFYPRAARYISRLVPMPATSRPPRQLQRYRGYRMYLAARG